MWAIKMMDMMWTWLLWYDMGDDIMLPTSCLHYSPGELPEQLLHKLLLCPQSQAVAPIQYNVHTILAITRSLSTPPPELAVLPGARSITKYLFGAHGQTYMCTVENIDINLLGIQVSHA